MRLYNRPMVQVLTSIALAVALPVLAHAQDARRVVISSRSACEKCRIDVTRVARLGGPEKFGGTGRIVQRDSRGRYYVVDLQKGPNEIFVFDREGRYFRTIGKEGSGPGEFRAISRLTILPGDTLLVEEARNPRSTTLSPDYEFVRTTPGRGDAMPRVRLADGRVVTSRHDPHPDRIGYPLHVLGPDGVVLRSFGTDQPVYRQGMRQSLVRALAPARGGRFYAAHTQEYIIEKWDSHGQLVREIVRDADWFRPWLTEPKRSPEGPLSQPRLLVVHEDEQGLLWVLIQVAQPDQKKHLYRPPARDGEDNPGWLIGGVTKNTGYDTMIEVIDPKNGKLLASRRVDQVFWKMFDGRLAYSDGEDEQLQSYVDIWQFRLIQP